MTILKSLINSLKIEKKHILGIIISGSFLSKNFNKNISDIDILFILDKLTFKNEKDIIDKCKIFEKKSNTKIGSSFLSIEEYKNPSCEHTYYKANLIRYNFLHKMSKIIYGDIDEIYVDLPENKEYIIRELNYFKARIRNTIRNTNKLDCLKECIKCLQHVILIACFLASSDKEKVSTPSQEICTRLFPDSNLDFSIYNKITIWKKNIDKVKFYNKKIELVFNFTEDFLIYIFSKYLNV